MLGVLNFFSFQTSILNDMASCDFCFLNHSILYYNFSIKFEFVYSMNFLTVDVLSVYPKEEKQHQQLMQDVVYTELCKLSNKHSTMVVVFVKTNLARMISGCSSLSNAFMP